MTVVAHQNGAQQRLAVCADHHAAVMAGLLVVKAYVAGAGSLAVGIANGADIDAQQFQLGAHVGASKGRIAIAVQNRSQGASHGIAWGDQPKNPLVPECALANGMDMRV